MHRSGFQALVEVEHRAATIALAGLHLRKLKNESQGFARDELTSSDQNIQIRGPARVAHDDRLRALSQLQRVSDRESW